MWPELPLGIVDRPAEVWEPLIAIADMAGGEWPARARVACVELCKVAEDRRASLGVRLLSDLRIIFRDADAMHTQTILDRLKAGDDLEADAPWDDLRGKPLAVRGLATMLRQYGVQPIKVNIGGKRLQGYRREDLWDAWQRYLPPVSVQAEPPEPAELSLSDAGSRVPDSAFHPDDPEPDPEPANVEAARDCPEVPEVPEIRDPESAFIDLVRRYGADHGASLDSDQIMAELDADDRADLQTSSDEDRQEWAELLAHRLHSQARGSGPV
jgi:gluconate kinase